MLRNRCLILVLLGVCFLTASAAWADDLGYVNCSSHPEATQVFGKPRNSPETVASLPCGERFTVLVYGFIFSRIETSDGKVGYVFSSLISVDHSAASVQQVATARVPVARSNAPGTAVAERTEPATLRQPQRTNAQPAPAQAPTPALPEPIAKVPETAAAAAVQPNPTPLTQPQPASDTLPASAAPPRAPEPASSAPTSANPNSSEPIAPDPVASEPVAKAPETTPTATVQPDPAASAQPEPAPAQPAAPAIRSTSARTSWEKPNPGGRRPPRVELFGGYAFARMAGGGTASNLNGALGSFGLNIKPWLQIVADTSYSVVTVSGTKNVLYGNHYGPRFFRRGRNRWGATPFVEALVGGSRADTIVSGTGGYTYSANTISYKAGGGLDINPSRHFQIRLFDVDYYRTSFGVNAHQNNYWASTGIVLRLFGRGAE
jgi:hypothetical protein